MSETSAIGEVLASSITGFNAEAWSEGYDAESEMKIETTPSFGSFVKSYSEENRLSVYGVVYNIITGPQDQHHKPTALRMTRKELKAEQPQIFSLLKTHWQVAIIGYRNEKSSEMSNTLPPLPPQVHDFVYLPENNEIFKISESLEFLRMLTSVTGSIPQDELMAAAIRQAASARKGSYDFLLAAGQQVSKLFRDDYERMVSVLRKIKP